jgi:hypothetical protein
MFMCCTQNPSLFDGYLSRYRSFSSKSVNAYCLQLLKKHKFIPRAESIPGYPASYPHGFYTPGFGSETVIHEQLPIATLQGVHDLAKRHQHPAPATGDIPHDASVKRETGIKGKPEGERMTIGARASREDANAMEVDFPQAGLASEALYPTLAVENLTVVSAEAAPSAQVAAASKTITPASVSSSVPIEGTSDSDRVKTVTVKPQDSTKAKDRSEHMVVDSPVASAHGALPQASVITTSFEVVAPTKSLPLSEAQANSSPSKVPFVEEAQAVPEPPAILASPPTSTHSFLSALESSELTEAKHIKMDVDSESNSLPASPTRGPACVSGPICAPVSSPTPNRYGHFDSYNILAFAEREMPRSPAKATPHSQTQRTVSVPNSVSQVSPNVAHSRSNPFNAPGGHAGDSYITTSRLKIPAGRTETSPRLILPNRRPEETPVHMVTGVNAGANGGSGSRESPLFMNKNNQTRKDFESDGEEDDDHLPITFTNSSSSPSTMLPTRTQGGPDRRLKNHPSSCRLMTTVEAASPTNSSPLTRKGKAKARIRARDTSSLTEDEDRTSKKIKKESLENAQGEILVFDNEPIRVVRKSARISSVKKYTA